MMKIDRSNISWGADIKPEGLILGFHNCLIWRDNGILWNIMEIMEYYGITWNDMEYYGILWHITGSGD